MWLRLLIRMCRPPPKPHRSSVHVLGGTLPLFHGRGLSREATLWLIPLIISIACMHQYGHSGPLGSAHMMVRALLVGMDRASSADGPRAAGRDGQGELLASYEPSASITLHAPQVDSDGASFAMLWNARAGQVGAGPTPPPPADEWLTMLLVIGLIYLSVNGSLAALFSNDLGCKDGQRVAHKQQIVLTAVAVVCVTVDLGVSFAQRQVHADHLALPALHAVAALGCIVRPSPVLICRTDSASRGALCGGRKSLTGS